MQIQDLAIRCVQKNIKKNKGVKDWPWWKLFTTVRPLIEVQLTEEQIRGKDVGITALWGWGTVGLGEGRCWAEPFREVGCGTVCWMQDTTVGEMHDPMVVVGPHGGCRNL